MLLALAVTVGLGVVRGATAPVQSIAVTSTGAPPPSPPAMYVHVSGAVRAPGLYVLRGSARVVDAIAAAGGFADGADSSGVNLARPVSDGEQLHVAAQGESPPTGAGTTGSGAGTPDGRVNLNTADAAQLDTLPRIGAAMAERIIQWRDANGRFTSVEDLLAVPGIGDKMLESLRDLVTI